MVYVLETEIIFKIKLDEIGSVNSKEDVQPFLYKAIAMLEDHYSQLAEKEGSKMRVHIDEIIKKVSFCDLLEEEVCKYFGIVHDKLIKWGFMRKNGGYYYGFKCCDKNYVHGVHMTILENYSLKDPEYEKKIEKLAFGFMCEYADRMKKRAEEAMANEDVDSAQDIIYIIKCINKKDYAQFCVDEIKKQLDEDLRRNGGDSYEKG